MYENCDGFSSGNGPAGAFADEKSRCSNANATRSDERCISDGVRMVAMIDKSSSRLTICKSWLSWTNEL